MSGAAIRPNAWALLPFGVFAVFYVGLSLALGGCAQVPMPIAFLVASAVALVMGRASWNDRIEIFARGMGEANIMIMCLVFVLAGAFAGAAKGVGAVEAAVTLARACVPVDLMLAGVFGISCLISLAVGTSCGTIAAVAPIALGFAAPLDMRPAVLLGAVVGGAMFGDNLSMISDTTIAATRTQGIAMREKFFANAKIALPAAGVCALGYVLFGRTDGATAERVSLAGRDFLLVLPYLFVLAGALVGINVMALLFLGTLFVSAFGLAFGGVHLADVLGFLGKGTLDMSETLIVALLAGGLFRLVEANGGVAALTRWIARGVRGPASCAFGMFGLVALVNVFTANNTVAIVVAGPIARLCGERFGVRPARMASVLDTASCVVQGVLPYGAQVLIALGIAKTAAQPTDAFDLILNLPYPFFLAAAVVVHLLATGCRRAMRT